MVRKKQDETVKRFERKFGGEGYITVRSLVNSDAEMNGKGRVFAHTTLLPGHGIGFHTHTGESETYYIYSGRAEFNDNGRIVPVEAGDVTFTPAGQGHGIRCVGDEPLQIIALILYSA